MIGNRSVDWRPYWLRLCWSLVVIASVFILVGCSVPQAPAGPKDGESSASLASATATPDHSAYWLAWQESPHADTYSLEKGPNTYCARCHSPGNWDPAATIDPPPNCVSCKFAFEDQPRIAAGNPLVPEEEWQSIGCNVCHRQNEDGVVESQIAWHDPISGYYETVTDATDLCTRCHRDTETLRHNREIGNAHSDFACTDCHDAHSVIAACEDCHDRQDVLKEVRRTAVGGQEAHDDAHDMVACVACHDASGLHVGPLDDGNAWMTFRTTELLGRANTEPYHSHTLQREVDCGRCHYPDNQWNLRVVDENE